MTQRASVLDVEVETSNGLPAEEQLDPGLPASRHDLGEREIERLEPGDIITENIPVMRPKVITVSDEDPDDEPIVIRVP